MELSPVSFCQREAENDRRVSREKSGGLGSLPESHAPQCGVSRLDVVVSLTLELLPHRATPGERDHAAKPHGPVRFTLNPVPGNAQVAHPATEGYPGLTLKTCALASTGPRTTPARPGNHGTVAPSRHPR